MLALRLQFPGGRFHATPWGRHVNEAEVAWPPDPWRLCRALIATWHRKLAAGQWSRPALTALLARLATLPPVYSLPRAVHAHARHYMPIRSGKGETRTLIFDAFARIDPSEALIMAWPALSLNGEQGALLDALLEATGYLGRAESWLEGARLDAWQGEPNCLPAEGTLYASPGTTPDVVTLLLPRTPEDYGAFRSHFLEAQSARGQTTNRQLATTLPEDWLAALSVETADLHAAGWSQPPAARQVRYLRPADCLKPAGLFQSRRRPLPTMPTTVGFALYGKPLPRIEDSVRVGEWLRAAVMSQAKRLLGTDSIPDVLSGHGAGKGHRHAFFLSEDRDGDGRIDHLLVHAPVGLEASARSVLDRLERLWNHDGQEWRLILEAMGSAVDLSLASSLIAESTTWESITPYLHPWHLKKGFAVADQLRRELRERDLPNLAAVEPLETVRVGGRERRPIHFHRFRSKRGLTQPDTRGSFWRLSLREPYRGLLALGFGCHFGLGMFRPMAGS